jgi:hypothetical protein
VSFLPDGVALPFPLSSEVVDAEIPGTSSDGGGSEMGCREVIESFEEERDESEEEADRLSCGGGEGRG